jgi:5'-deoxynucleotidase YfbR-like HD superfamily hydrolase
VDLVPQENNMLNAEDGWETYWSNMFNKIEENKINDQKLRDKMAIKDQENPLGFNNFELDNVIDPESFGGEDFPPICSDEDAAYIKELYATDPRLQKAVPTDVANRAFDKANGYLTGSSLFNGDDAWIQTYSGQRFNPTNPVPDAILIQDIAHALSNQCRFSGHSKKFYSVAQHCVLVSHVCNFEDALWGLLHDATEAYLVDVPRPLKQSGLFGAYIEFEGKMTLAICERFGLDPVEPVSVKRADKIMLATEARDLMAPLRVDWTQPTEPLPFTIEPWTPEESKERFLKRFFELNGTPEAYDNLSKYVK